MLFRTIILAVVFVFCFAFVAMAEDGVTEKEIVIGQSCALDGPAKALGTGMNSGMTAYFEKINKDGGINGRKIKLICKDDGYEPEKAIQNTQDLIDNDKVFMLMGEVGTPTSKAVLPIAEKAKVPFFGPFTGAEFLRKSPMVVNVRGSYFQEMEKLAEYLVDKKGLKNIACFYQNDGYGQAGLEGIEKALEKRKMKLVEKGTYTRNTTAVNTGLIQIRRAKPDAIVMVGAYAPCAEFIKQAKTKFKMQDVIFCNISFVGTEALLKELGEDGEGCIISQVVSFPWDESVPLVKEYKAAMKEYQKDQPIGFVSLEGYMVAKLFCMVVEKVEGELTRENFLKTLKEIKKFDLGGLTLEFGDEDNQGMDKVFLTIIKDKEIKPLKEE